jgi:hypothetical protein
MPAGPAVEQSLEVGRQSIRGRAVRESNDPSANAPVVLELHVPAGRLDEHSLAILGEQAFPGSATASLVRGVLASIPVGEDSGVGRQGSGVGSLENSHGKTPPSTVRQGCQDGPTGGQAGRMFLFWYCRVLVTIIIPGEPLVNKT